MSEQETRGGGFDRLLKAALDGDDAEALDTVMAAVRGVACRAGAYYRFPATECDDFAQWACEDLLKRLRNARRKGKRSDPLTYALDVVAENHADKDWEAQCENFFGIIYSNIRKTQIPGYFRDKKGGKRVPTVPIDNGERPIDPPAPIPPKNEDAEKTLQRFEAWIAGQNIRVRAIYHLRHYFLLNGLPTDVLLHLRDVQSGLGDQAIPGLNGAPDAEAFGAALDKLLQNAQLDDMGRVRWEIVAWLLGRPRNLLEVCWCHAKNKFKRQLREGGEDA